MADLILVNKADGDLKSAATRTCADYSGALRLLRKRSQDPEGFPKAMMVSALDNSGLDRAWAEMQDLSVWRKDNGHWTGRRANQARYWLEQEVRQSLLSVLEKNPAKAELRQLADAVAKGDMPAAVAANAFLNYLKAQ